MFLAKLALYGTIAGTFFTVSAFSTVQITKQANKTAVPNEIEDEDDEYNRELSDTERFINSLTAFGNMSGSINASISKGGYNLSVNGNVFVSMESMDDIQVEADLAFTTLGRTFDLSATYVDDTIFATIGGNNVKLKTSSFSEITSLLEETESSIELPEVFKNIDVNALISNLSAMTAERGAGKITYTCNLIEGIPPIIFTSDYDYNLTSVSIQNALIEGFKIDVKAITTVYGSGHNRIINPETKNSYTDLENYFGVIKHVKDIIDNKELSIGYNVDVLKKTSSTTDELIFNIKGDTDISIKDLSNINNAKVNFTGRMTNNDANKLLDSSVSIKLYEGTVYFDYNKELRLAYSIDSIKDLVDIIKNKIQNNSSSDVAAILDQLFPHNDDTTSAPIVDIIANQKYVELLKYYSYTKIDNKKRINVVFDGDLIGNNRADIVLILGANKDRITGISINGIYALGYTLNCSFELNEYHDFSLTQGEKNSYTNLKYINNVFDQVYELVKKKQFNINLNGTMDLGNGSMSINGVSYVSLSNPILNSNSRYKKYDVGVAELNVIDTDNKTHNIKIDVSRNINENKISQDAIDEALRTSAVLFKYNNNLKGKFNLKSASDTFSLIKRLAADGNPLLDKLKGLLARDATQSTINRILNGEPEAILYDNSLDSITHYIKDDGSHYYDIQINGNLFKKDNDDVVSPIHIYINMSVNHEFEGIGIKGSINGYAIDINASITSSNGNPLSWGRLDPNDNYYDFSDMNVLTDYLFNTGAKTDFTMSGYINANVVNIFDVANIQLRGKVHIDRKTKKTISIVEIDNIPQIEYLFGAIQISDDDWDYRKCTMYITDDEVYINVYYRYDYTNWSDWLKTYRKTTNKWVKLSMKEFGEDLAYYLVNFGLGVTTGSIAGTSLDMRNTSSSSGDIDYSKLLTKYNSSIDDTPTWNLGINLSELANSSALGNLNATIKGNKDTKVLKEVTATTKLAGLVNATVYASLDNNDPLGFSTINDIDYYIYQHKADNNKQIYSSVSDVKK